MRRSNLVGLIAAGEATASVLRRVLRNPALASNRSKSRRVSFDPLALLLDASLEGELELVKKTALEVRGPAPRPLPHVPLPSFTEFLFDFLAYYLVLPSLFPSSSVIT